MMFPVLAFDNFTEDYWTNDKIKGWGAVCTFASKIMAIIGVIVIKMFLSTCHALVLKAVFH